MDIKFFDLEGKFSGVMVFPVNTDLVLGDFLQRIDDTYEGAIVNAIKNADFKGKNGESISILGGIGDIKRIILIGIGKGEEDGENNALDSEKAINNLGGSIYGLLNGAKISKARLYIENSIGGFSPDFVAANIAYGALLKSYKYDDYKEKPKDSEKQHLMHLNVATSPKDNANHRFDDLSNVAKGVFFARNLVTDPPNHLYPESYAEECKMQLKPLGVKVEVLGEKEMKKLGMGSILSVGQGSEKETKIVIMQYNGAKKSDQPVAFVGKGVTFDTGGISLKPGANMGDMKYDMAGSAAVAGVIYALAARGAKVNAVGVIGLAENMPGSKASRPSDVVTSMSGQSIEILNTDAEGRMVLADALWYTQDRFQPKFMINLATLTGAMVIALGLHRAGTFSNNDELAENLYKSGESVNERVWRFPLGPEYDKQMDSPIADMQNISNMKGAGSITAAQFLQRFVNDTPWVHIDIAGTAWEDKGTAITPKGASGFGVRLLDRLVSDYYEA